VDQKLTSIAKLSGNLMLVAGDFEKSHQCQSRRFIRRCTFATSWQRPRRAGARPAAWRLTRCRPRQSATGRDVT